MNTTCSAEPCPIILNSSCVFYRGGILLYTGINSGDNLQTSLQKIDAKFQDASIGYIFNNGLVQSSPGLPVQFGGKLIQDTTIDNSEYLLSFTGTVYAPSFKIPLGTSTQFLKADGTLDDTIYGIGNVSNISINPGYGISASISNPTTTPEINITNTAPDQTVVIYGGPGILVTGTYPEFTIYNTSLPSTIIESLSVSAPLQSTGGNNPNISIQQASTFSDGYLSLTDWNIFNNKLNNINGIVAGGDLSGTYPNPTVVGLLGNEIPSNTNGYLHNNGTGNLSWADIPSSTNTLSQTLSYGNTTGGYNIILSTTDAIIINDNGSKLAKGSVDKGLGGNYGISLICSVGYELNWQAGYLTTTNWNISQNGAVSFDSGKFTSDGSGNVTANSFIKSGGTSSQFLKADGSLDSNTYLTVSGGASTYLPLAGGTLSGDVQQPTAPVNGTSLINKNYVDNIIIGVIWVGADTDSTSNITLSGEQTINGITTSNSRVFVHGQINQTQNGIYISSSGAWSRSSDASTSAQIIKLAILIEGGSNKGQQWVNTNSTIILGSTNITFGQNFGIIYGAGTGLLLSGTSFTIDSSYTATSSRTGYLSSTDWTIFNNKQAALGFTPYNSTNPSNYISLTALSSTATGLTYTNTTGVFSLTSGYLIPTTASYNNTNWDTAYTNRITSLTTTGSSGSATLVSNTLNIPTYTLAGLGGISLTALSATTPLLYNNTTGVFSIQIASTSQSGYLSSTDWNTFNSKQAALSGNGVVKSTSGTISYISGTSSQFLKADGSLDNNSYALSSSATQWTTSGSNIYYNTGAVTIGGTGAITQGLWISDGNTPVSGSYSTNDFLVISRQAASLGLTYLVASSSVSQAAYIKFSKARGTLATPTVVQIGDSLGAFNINGYDGSSYVNSASFYFTVSGTVSTGIVPTSYVISLQNAAGSLQTALQVNSLNTNIYSNTTQVANIGNGSILYSSNAVILQLSRSSASNTVIQYTNTSGSVYTGINTNATQWGVGNSANLTDTTNTIMVAQLSTRNVIIGASVTDNAVDKLQVIGSITATSHKVTGGTSSQFQKGDGSLDTSTYLTTNQTISFTPSGDISSTGGSGATSLTPTISVTKILGNTIPANASGVLTNNGSGTLSWAASSSSPAGSTGQIQYNNSGAFGASSKLNFEPTNIGLLVGSLTGNGLSNQSYISKIQFTNGAFGSNYAGAYISSTQQGNFQGQESIDIYVGTGTAGSYTLAAQFQNGLYILNGIGTFSNAINIPQSVSIYGTNANPSLNLNSGVGQAAYNRVVNFQYSGSTYALIQYIPSSNSFNIGTTSTNGAGYWVFLQNNGINTIGIYSGGRTLLQNGGTFTDDGINTLQVSGRTKLNGQVSYGGSTPTIAAGTGAGTSPTVSIVGTNNGGVITVTTGTLPSSSATLVTITYTGAFATGSQIILYPTNANTALLSGVSMVYTTGTTTTFTITTGTTALTAATTYAWAYVVTGY